MSNPFVGEIRVVGFNFAPRGWATCDGQTIAIAQNSALFSLLGVNFGGNGTSNFGLPNLQGRAAISWGQGPGLASYNMGASGGSQTVTLNQATTPAHNHNSFMGDAEPAVDLSPAADLYAGTPARTYGPISNNTTFAANAMQIQGSSQPHDNMPPYVTMLYIIALQGIYPARN